MVTENPVSKKIVSKENITLLLDELRPSPEALQVLHGTVSEPQTVRSLKPWLKPPLNEDERAAGGREIHGVSLVYEGSGLLGLTDYRDSREWSGINNHTWLSTRLALHVAAEAAAKGEPVNLQTILDGGVVSHAGRRQSDEAYGYPSASYLAEEVVNDDQRAKTRGELRREITNEVLGLRLIKGKVSDDAFSLVAALAHDTGNNIPEAEELLNYDSWEYRIFSYIDHRTTQDIYPLHERMAGFLIGNFMDKGVSGEQRAKTIAAFEDIVVRRKDGEIEINEACDIAMGLGACKTSIRSKLDRFMQLLLDDADTEVELEKRGIDVANISPDTVPMQQWEKDLREQYILDAEESIIARLDEIHIMDSETRDATLAQEFPAENWWGKAVREKYNNFF